MIETQEAPTKVLHCHLSKLWKINQTILLLNIKTLKILILSLKMEIILAMEDKDINLITKETNLSINANNTESVRSNIL